MIKKAQRCNISVIILREFKTHHGPGQILKEQIGIERTIQNQRFNNTSKHRNGKSQDG